ncbi:23094_t:CDS:1, partial [Gigaspora rosea]
EELTVIIKEFAYQFQQHVNNFLNNDKQRVDNFLNLTTTFYQLVMQRELAGICYHRENLATSDIINASRLDTEICDFLHNLTVISIFQLI